MIPNGNTFRRHKTAKEHRDAKRDNRRARSSAEFDAIQDSVAEVAEPFLRNIRIDYDDTCDDLEDELLQV